MKKPLVYKNPILDRIGIEMLKRHNEAVIEDIVAFMPNPMFGRKSKRKEVSR